MTIIFEDREIQKFLRDTQAKMPFVNEKIVSEGTIFGLRKTKTTLPKRRGSLRGSYRQKKIGKLSRLISSDSPYAEGVETGFKAKVIRPKRAKFLTIPTKKSVLTGTRSQIRQGALNTLFRRLKKRGGQSSGDIMRSVGIALAKKARIPRIRGQFNFERNITPAVTNRLEFLAIKAYRRLGFT